MAQEIFAADEDDWFGISNGSRGGVDFMSATPLRMPVSLEQLMRDQVTMCERQEIDDAPFPTHMPRAAPAAVVSRPTHRRRIRPVKQPFDQAPPLAVAQPSTSAIMLDIARFNMNNDKQDVAGKVRLAVALGAKPPKRAAVNYKILKERQKVNQQAKKESREAFRLQTALHSKKVKTAVKHKAKQHGKGVKKRDTTNEKVKRLH